MKQSISRVPTLQLRTTYVTAIVSISLVLFILGLFGLLWLSAGQLSRYVRENIGFSVIVKNDASASEMLRLQKRLDAMPFIKETEMVGKDKAAERLQTDLGEDFVDIIGQNTLPNTIDVRFHAEYTHPDSVAKIERLLADESHVKEIFYHKSLITKVNDNIKKVSAVLLVFALILFFISAVLINNTIRMSVHGKRFIIHIMQLVGATKSFIVTPFVLKSALQGLYSSLIALCMLSGFIYFAQQEFREVASNQDFKIIAILYISTILTGMCITMISTYFAVSRYINIHRDDLYIY